MLIGLIGPPASGKGTLAKLIERDFGLKHLSIGEILRKTNSPKYPSSQISIGALADDELVINLLSGHLGNKSLIDGFPRTIFQAQSIRDGKIPMSLILNIQCDKELLRKRSKNRLIHPSSGRTYHSVFNPPIVPMRDDITMEPLVMRSDDDPAVFESRLTNYNESISKISEILGTVMKNTPIFNTSSELYTEFVKPFLTKLGERHRV
jgi:adenylate kinase family enzyme